MHKDVRVIMYNANVVIIKGRINPTARVSIASFFEAFCLSLEATK